MGPLQTTALQVQENGMETMNTKAIKQKGRRFQQQVVEAEDVLVIPFAIFRHPSEKLMRARESNAMFRFLKLSSLLAKTSFYSVVCESIS